MTGLPSLLLSAQVELRDRDEAEMMGGTCLPAWKYLRDHSCAAPFHGIGGYTVLPIIDCGAARFDFANGEDDAFPAFIMEAFDAQDEHVADLAAWPLDRPWQIFTMFGQVPFLGWNWATNPGTYSTGLPLDIHWDGASWLRAGCRGAVVAVPHLAASIMLGLPGTAGRDPAHTRQLLDLARSAVPKLDPNRFFSASPPRRAA